MSEVVLKKHCVRCHGEKTQEARLRVDRLDRDFLSGKDADVWHEVLNKVTGGEMPPEDEPPLSTAERKALVEWIRGGLKAAAEHRRSTGGQVVIRRLTRYEYQHTMEDLLDLAMDFSSDLPEEAISQDGFLNNGQTLLMSPIQMETYLQVARRALDIRLGIAARENESSNGGKSQQNWLFHIDSDAERQALLSKTKPAPSPPVNPKKKPKKKRPAKAKDGMQQRDIGQNTGGRDGIYVNPLSVEEFEKRRSTGRPFEPVTIKPNFRQVYTLTGWPLEGEILVRVRVAAGSTGSPKMTALVGFRASGAVMTMKSIGSGLVTGSPDEPQTFEFRARMENLPVFLTGKEKFKGEHLAISNDSISADLLLDSVEFICPAPRRRDFESAFLDRHAGDTNTRYALRVLHRFTRVAWRRPVTREELERLVELYEDIAERSGRHDIALRDTLAAVLSSPNFLYLAEPATEDAAKGNSLTDHELAARLSYFLWSTMPDRELRGLADVHQLRNEEMLAKQTRRLLADPRSERFVRNFTYQWLDLNGLARVAVNPEYFPKYDDDLKSASAEETYAFFREVLRSELPVTTFLPSYFAMHNDRMAPHYSIHGVCASLVP
ncbi:MAG: DUF1592 domain-containing protein, partial [Planctomycetes bacterium]|nr:DUF1592 domain-containing protein [Planctomycetota bacterium]